jgi:hypothetical protein
MDNNDQYIPIFHRGVMSWVLWCWNLEIICIKQLQQFLSWSDWKYNIPEQVFSI